jgi:hypothetical protein
MEWKNWSSHPVIVSATLIIAVTTLANTLYKDHVKHDSPAPLPSPSTSIQQPVKEIVQPSPTVSPSESPQPIPSPKPSIQTPVKEIVSSPISSCNYFTGKAVEGQSINVDLCSVSPQNSGAIAFTYSLGSQKMESTTNCTDGTWITFHDGQTHRPQSLATER